MTAIVYGKDTCAYCDRSKELLEDAGIEYVYKNIEESAQAMAEMQVKFPGARTVPQIVIDDEYIGGFDDLRKYLKER